MGQPQEIPCMVFSTTDTRRGDCFAIRRAGQRKSVQPRRCRDTCRWDRKPDPGVCLAVAAPAHASSSALVLEPRGSPLRVESVRFAVEGSWRRERTFRNPTCRRPSAAMRSAFGLVRSSGFSDCHQLTEALRWLPLNRLHRSNSNAGHLAPHLTACSYLYCRLPTGYCGEPLSTCWQFRATLTEPELPYVRRGPPRHNHWQNEVSRRRRAIRQHVRGANAESCAHFLVRV